MVEPEKKFDPQRFLDEYEDNISTSIRKSNKAKENPTQEETPPPEKQPEEATEPIKETQPTLRKPRKKKVETKGSITDDPRIATYCETFLTDRVGPRFSQKGRLVAIDKEFHEKINLIKALYGDISIVGYVHNVLTQHFEEMEDIIDALLKDCLLNR